MICQTSVSFRKRHIYYFFQKLFFHSCLWQINETFKITYLWVSRFIYKIDMCFIKPYWYTTVQNHFSFKSCVSCQWVYLQPRTHCLTKCAMRGAYSNWAHHCWGQDDNSYLLNNSKLLNEWKSNIMKLSIVSSIGLLMPLSIAKPF